MVRRVTISGNDTPAEKATTAHVRGIPEATSRIRSPESKPGLALRQGYGGSADLRPGDIHQYFQVASQGTAGGADIGCHRAPGVRSVMGAIDARDIHSGARESEDEIRSFRRFAWQGHHDPGSPVRSRLTEHRVRRVDETDLAGKEIGLAGCRNRALAPCKRRESNDYSIERRQHPAFQTAERGKTKTHQPALERAQVVMAQDEIVGEIGKCRIGCGHIRPEVFDKRHGGFHDGGPEGHDFIHQGGSTGHFGRKILCVHRNLSEPLANAVRNLRDQAGNRKKRGFADGYPSEKV